MSLRKIAIIWTLKIRVKPQLENSLSPNKIAIFLSLRKIAISRGKMAIFLRDSQPAYEKNNRAAEGEAPPQYTCLQQRICSGGGGVGTGLVKLRQPPPNRSSAEGTYIGG